MQRAKPEILIVGIGVAVAFIGLMVFQKWFDAHEGLAAWVQAIGAIGVIVATAWIANINFSEEKDHARNAERQLKESVSILAKNCLDRLDYILSNVREGHNNRDEFINHYTPSDFEGPMEGLAAIPLHHLGDANLITAVIDLRREMGRIKARLDAFKASLTDPLASQVFDVQELRGRQVLVFNAMASVMRIAVPEAKTYDQVSHLAARAKGPLS